MTRVLFICRRFCPGEAWTNRLLAYAKGFSENGINVCILFLITDEKRTPYTINIPKVEVVNLWENDGPVARMHRAISYIKNRRRVKDFIKDGDICFMTDASGFYLEEVRAAGKNVKTVFESTEHPIVLAQGNQKKVNALLRRLHKIDYLFVISHSLKDYYINSGISEDKVHIINMFVDTSRFNGLTKNTTRKYIAYCGNVSYDKDGVDILIKAFAKFSQHYTDYKLEIYGRSVGDSKHRLQKLADNLGITDKVIFTGMVPYFEIPQKLVNASILALSRPDNLQNQNGFPTKLGEYLMSGNPVVVTTIGEIPLYIQDNHSGYLALPGDVNSFAEKLSQAAQNETESNEIARRGRDIAMIEFSSVVQTKKALDIIKSQTV